MDHLRVHCNLQVIKQTDSGIDFIAPVLCLSGGQLHNCGMYARHDQLAALVLAAACLVLLPICLQALTCWRHLL